MAQEFAADKHEPVLPDAAIEALRITPGRVYIDATYGRGGHSREILKRIGRQGRLLAFDKDIQACEHARTTLRNDQRFSICHASFAAIGSLLTDDNMEGAVAGILFDLGVSSPQLASNRGFSFDDDASLDMRMDTSRGISAAEWINRAPVSEIARVLTEFGEERNAKRISAAIAGSRPLRTARELAELIASVSGARERKRPATRAFLALRIFINNELEELSQALEHARRLLRSSGRLVVISFHSLEDRIVKNFIREYSQPRKAPLNLPAADDYSHVALRKIGRIVADEAELARNPRARSASLRVAEKL